MIVCHHQSGFIDYEARAKRGGPPRSIIFFALAIAIEKLFEKLFEWGAGRELEFLWRSVLGLRFDFLGRRYVHHRRRQAFRQIGEAFRRRTSGKFSAGKTNKNQPGGSDKKRQNATILFGRKRVYGFQKSVQQNSPIFSVYCMSFGYGTRLWRKQGKRRDHIIPITLLQI